jgi:membrane protein
MFARVRALAVDTVKGFFADEALVRGASIAYFTLFSIAPLIVIAVAVAGAVFGDEAVSGAVSAQLRGLLGDDAAKAVEAMVAAARGKDASALAGVVGLGTLLFAASGTFGALQSALNAIWKTETPDEGGITALVRAKLAAIGLVAATAFLLLVSLVASAAIAAFGAWATAWLPGGGLLLQAVEVAVSLGLLTALFAAVYKVLPDRRMAWRDVLVGAFATAVLFAVGKTAIALYIGYVAIGSAYGAAGSLVVVLVWVYYSALIFLLGAEFTRAWAGLEGSRQAAPVPADTAQQPPPSAPAGRRGRPRPIGGGMLALAALLPVAARAWRSLRRAPR